MFPGAVSKSPNAIAKSVLTNQLNTTDTESSKKELPILSRVNAASNAPASFSIVERNGHSSFLPYPKIKQFSDVVRQISKISYPQKCEPRPTVSFHGTVKLHGANGAVAHDYSTGDTWAQSRNLIIKEGVADNKNFAAYVNNETSRPVFNNIFKTIDEFRKDGESRVAVYGEWCGKGIQKNVAVSDLPPRFVVFNIGFFDDAGQCRWLNPADMHNVIEKSRGAGWSDNSPIFSTEDFKTWDIEIDFDKQESIDSAAVKLSEYTIEVEGKCPVGEKFGKSGLGEGIVWKSQEQSNKNSSTQTDGLMFKVKGPKHSETNVKVLVPVHPEKIVTIEQFAENVITDNRLENVLSKLPDSERNVKNFCQKVKGDVFSEENLSISDNKLNKRAIAKIVDKLATEWFLKEDRISVH